ITRTRETWIRSAGRHHTGADAREPAAESADLARDRDAASAQVRESSRHSIRDNADRDSVFKLQHVTARDHECCRATLSQGRLGLLQLREYEFCKCKRNSPAERSRIRAER